MKYAVTNVFPGVGRCIYCGATEGLTREHIIPYSLGGNYVFQRASCPRCSEITRQDELLCARGIFGPLRLAHRFPTRHKHERPTHVSVEIRAGGQQERIDVAVDQAPTTPILVPIFPTAGILVDRPPSEEIADIQYHLVFPLPPDHDQRLQRLKKEGPTEVRVNGRFGLNPLMCMLAKIGHGFAVAAHGPESFSPLLPDYILDRDRRLSHVIGGTTDRILLPPRGGTSWDTASAIHAWTVGIRSISGKHYVAVLIQLFRYLNLPVYEVVAGEASQKLVEEVLG